MENLLQKEVQATVKQHILVYKFLLHFYKQHKLFDENVYSQIKKYCLILKTLKSYSEHIIVKSTFNIGILFSMFDKSVSPLTQSFINILKKNLIKRMKKLKYLKKNTITYKRGQKHKTSKTKVRQVKNSDGNALEHPTIPNEALPKKSCTELIKKIKVMFNLTYSEKAQQKHLELKAKFDQEEESLSLQGDHDKLNTKRKFKRNSWSRGVIPRNKHKKVKTVKTNDKIEETKKQNGESKTEEDKHPQMINNSNIIDLCGSDNEDKQSVNIDTIFDETADKTPITSSELRSVFSDYKIINCDKTREVSIVKAMQEMLPHLPSLQNATISPVNHILKKLKLTSSFYDYKFQELNMIEHEELIKTYDAVEIENNLNSQTIPSSILIKPPNLTVGPFQVRNCEEEHVFTCTIAECNNWKTSNLSLLHRHIQACHLDIRYNWFCSMCACVDVAFYSMTDYSDLESAFLHLVSNHIHKKKDANYLLEKYQERNGSYIPQKVKVDDSDAGGDLKIISVSSLNPSFTGGSYCLNKFSEIPKLFKCPSATCTYTSDNEVSAFQHFLSEFDEDDSFKCAYCERNFTDAFQFCGHILEEHGMDKYQCTYCSYRSISKSNVVHHQMDLHTSNSVKVLIGKDKEHLKYSFPKCNHSIEIRPYRCVKNDCDYETSVIRIFLDHLSTFHKSSMFFRCSYCSFVTKIPSSFIEHMPDHGFGEFQCKYCPSASNNIQAIRRHMYQTHASRHPFCIQRATYETDSDRISKQFTISVAETSKENIIQIDLDTCLVEEFWDISVITVDEYEKSLNTFDCIDEFNEMEQKQQNEPITVESENCIVLSDSDNELELKINETVQVSDNINTKRAKKRKLSPTITRTPLTAPQNKNQPRSTPILSNNNNKPIKSLVKPAAPETIKSDVGITKTMTEKTESISSMIQSRDISIIWIDNPKPVPQVRRNFAKKSTTKNGFS